MLERAGAQSLTCHTRTREQCGQNTLYRFSSVSSVIDINISRILEIQGLVDWAREGGHLSTSVREREHPHAR